MSAFIQDIGTAVPKFMIPQEQVLKFMQKAHKTDSNQAKNLEILYRATGIRQRYSVIEDYQEPGVHTFFPDHPELEPFPDTKSRQDVFKREALGLSKEAAEKALGANDPASITHLITVSCTGLYAPGLDIELVTELGLNPGINRTAINFMGCYAAVNALKVAQAFCESREDAHVLIVCTELCTLHFQKEYTEDNILSNALFGDGSAAVLVTNNPVGLVFRIDDFYATLEPDGKSEMAWDVGNTGFEMKLSSQVPDHLDNGIHKIMGNLTHRFDLKNIAYFAFHPGGKRILQVMEDALGISREDNQYSHETLRDFGNMSSPTLLFVLKKIMDQLSPGDQEKSVMAMAFGPGLTLESMLLTITN